MTYKTKGAARNLAVLLFGALPAGIVTAWFQNVVAPAEWMRDVTDDPATSGVISTFLFWYFVMAAPTFVGGCVHQAIIWFARKPRNTTTQHVILILTTPVVLLGFTLVGSSLTFVMAPRATLPLVACLSVYGVFVRWPRAETRAG